MSDELCKLTAVQAVSLLRKGEVTPLELVEASARRIAEVEPADLGVGDQRLDLGEGEAEHLLVPLHAFLEGMHRERRLVELEHPIKTLGEHTLTLRIAAGTVATIHVRVERAAETA